MRRTDHKLRNIVLLSFISVSFFPASFVFASALKGLAEANLKTYQEIKAIGPAPTGAQMDAVRKRNFEPALQALYEERRLKYHSFKSKIRSLFKDTLEEIRALLGPRAATPGATTRPDATMTPASAPSVGRKDSVNTTGESEGFSGAKGVQFGGKRQTGPKPKVVDGILVPDQK